MYKYKRKGSPRGPEAIGKRKDDIARINPSLSMCRDRHDPAPR
jgi:hypothetical protein